LYPRRCTAGTELCHSLQVAKGVINLYTEVLYAKRPNATAKFRNIEQTVNKEDGSRFLLEMDVQLHQPKEETVHTSEYVYLKKGSSRLCHTTNFQWNKEAYVHLIVAGTVYIIIVSHHIKIAAQPILALSQPAARLVKCEMTGKLMHKAMP
jgi:hypothetical protein